MTAIAPPTVAPWGHADPAATGRDRFLSGRMWIAVFVLFALFFILTPYDLLSSVSGYSLAERRGEIDAALDTVEGGNMVRRVSVLLLLLAGVIALVLARRTPRRHRLAIVAPGVAFLLVALASPAWSDDAAFTLRRIIVLVVLAVSACGFARVWDLPTLARVTLALSGLSIACGLGAELLLGTMHPLDPEYRFRGLSHPNGMGQLCALFVLSALVLARDHEGRRPVLWWLCATLGIGLLLLTKARGALVGASAAIVVLALVTADRRAILFTGSALVAAVAAVLMLVPAAGSDLAALISLGRPGASGELLTLTGRTDLWHDLLQYVGQRPVLGYAYDSFWVPSRILDIARSQGWIVGSSHSGYMDVLISLGVVGLALYLGLLASCLWVAFRSRQSGGMGALFALVMLVWLVTNMFTEVIWFGTSIPSLVALMVVHRLALQEDPDAR
jgi:exopolysaccharide production protein ExoQ